MAAGAMTGPQETLSLVAVVVLVVGPRIREQVALVAMAGPVVVVVVVAAAVRLPAETVVTAATAAQS